VGEADETRRLVIKTLARAGVADDARPSARLGESTHAAIYESKLRAMLEALPELTVDVDASGAPGLVEVIGRLGEGGMGVVELARQRARDREVALKRLATAPDDPSEGYSLLDEARILGGLEHPNIVPVHAVGVDPELGPVVLLKRVQGVSWAEDLADDRDHLPHDARTLDKHLRVLLQVCNAAHFAHSRGVFHRDIKPANVMLGAYGEVYLLDWGLALDATSAANAPKAIAGTAAYLAPEMVDGDASAIDARTDVFLLGATLHEILTGRPRHTATQIVTCLAQAALAKPAKYGPEVPEALAAICNAACARDPKARFPSAQHLRDAVADYLDEREAQALLDAARDALAEAKRAPDDATRRLYEARFAAEQALRLRPGLVDAKRMRRRCIHAAIRHELERDNLPGARGLMDELEGARVPEALARLLEDAEDAHRREAERVERLRRDVDPEVSRRQRLQAGAGALVVIGAYQALMFWLYPVGTLEATPYLIAGALAVAPLVALALAVARSLQQTAMGRQFGWLLLAIVLSLLVSRTLAVIGDLSIATTIVLELATLSLIPIAVDTKLRGRVVVGAIGLVAAALCAAQPEWARYVHAAFTVGGALVMTVDNSVPQPAPPE